MPTDSPSGPAGSVKIVEFELFGQAFGAMSAGPLDPFNHAISFLVECDDRADIVVRSPSPTPYAGEGGVFEASRRSGPSPT